jgi:predicted component of type VI protein secretion system
MVTDRPISLGADPQCDVILKAQGGGVAPLHARIWCREGRFMIHQIADCQKIIVSGQPLVWGILEDGDELRIGDHRLTFELTAPSCDSI